ncbi:hypothetical protein JIN85_03675 [Luteolibacter pohnpeiensis]|uniref:Lipoprotein n=1 Tax=Luteolibacter pohnpeiensis TaxID=454153 RepID=A0A934S1H2_9BACT|nr:hypothetical protein [Luteolibacter pohnpeiensis]MBK1881500.1 hypothetical protein [Luteolibacter pohnpeiensis]
MTRRISILAWMLLSAASCDRAKDLATKVKSLAELTAAESRKLTDTPDPDLQKLVDQNSSGTLFRKDLPFPHDLTVQVTTSSSSEGSRVLVRNELGPQSSVRSGTETLVDRFRISGEFVRLSLETAQFEENVDPDDEGTVTKITTNPLAGRSVDLRRDGDKWVVAASKSVIAKEWAEGLLPDLDAMLKDNGAKPRGYWFGSRRFKVGDVVPLSGESMAILFGDKCSGSVTLKLEAFESTEGHPCGMFSIHGDYKRRGYVRPDGETFDQDVVIEGGKVWLSLLYPVVMREEMQTIETRIRETTGGTTSRSQGAFNTTIVRKWLKSDD